MSSNSNGAGDGSGGGKLFRFDGKKWIASKPKILESEDFAREDGVFHSAGGATRITADGKEERPDRSHAIRGKELHRSVSVV